MPTRFDDAYAARARPAGDRLSFYAVDEAGHFELIDPRSAAFRVPQMFIRAALTDEVDFTILERRSSEGRR